YVRAWAAANVPRLNQAPNPATLMMNSLLVAYAKGNVGEFNKELDDYKKWLKGHLPADVSQSKIAFESFFNHLQPFSVATQMYFGVFLLVCFSWLGWRVPLSRAALAALAFTLLLHAFAVWGRIYISGRPPVTNLYSASVFIGLGCAALCLVLELLFPLGIAN